MRVLKTSKRAIITALAFRADSRRLAAGCWGTDVRVWALDSEKRATIRKETRNTTFIGYLGDTDRLVVTSWSNPTCCWDTPAGPPRAIGPRTLYAESLDLSPDGTRFAAIDFATNALVCYDTADGRELWRAECGKHYRLPLRVRFDPTGTKLHAIGRRIGTYDAASGALLANFHLGFPVSFVPYVADFSPDGQWLVVRDSNRVQVRSMAGGGVVFDPENVPVHGLAVVFTPDGTRLAMVSNDGLDNPYLTHFWDTSSWQRLSSLDFGIGRVNVLAFSPDGLLGAVGTTDGRVVLWDL